jgi:hypothetical protein
VARGVALGARLAIAGDGAEDDPWVDLTHPLVAHAQTVQHPRAEGFQDDVVVLDKGQQRLAAALALEVQADRALVAVQG